MDNTKTKYKNFFTRAVLVEKYYYAMDGNSFISLYKKPKYNSLARVGEYRLSTIYAKHMDVMDFLDKWRLQKQKNKHEIKLIAP